MQTKYMQKRRWIKIGLFCGVFIGAFTAAFFYKDRFSRPDLTIVGYVNMTDGLGRQGPELIEAFMKEMTMNFKHARKIKHAAYPNKIDKILNKKSNKWGKVLIFEDILWGPWDTNNISKMKHCPKDTLRFAYSMYEATQLPQEWVDILNSIFDAALVPSAFLIDVYKNSGVRIPIFEVPLGLDLKRFLHEPLKEKRNDPMVFANFSAGTERKNHVTLIRAFHQAFGGDHGVLLRINVRNAEKETRNAITKELALLGYPKNIVFTQSTLTESDYLNEFRKTDCYVSPSKGEGFSIQPREAMCMGIPVIVTNNTGQTPICESGLVKVVESKISEIAVNAWGDYYGYHFNCNEEDLAAALKDMREHYEEYLEKGSAAREWAKQYQYAQLKPIYRNIIKPSRAVLGKENKVTSTHLVTNSMALFKKYKKLFGKEIVQSDSQYLPEINDARAHQRIP